MLKCGLLGRKLSHSYSPQIHSMLDEYEYLLYEKEPKEIPELLKSDFWRGFNVTIPYKKTVIPYLDQISDTVSETGSANTLVKREDGTVYGDNTDVYGFTELVRHSKTDVKGKKVLVLGNGGACASVLAALKRLGADSVVISRSGENNYENLYLHKDARVIVNTTPLGMYPNNLEAAVDLNDFPKCESVLDLIYNPNKTALLLQAERLSIKNENGLYMLVAQAKRSSELFTGKSIPDSETDRIFSLLEGSMKNIILIGMPGCGKSTVASELSRLTGRTALDSDGEIYKKTGLKPSQIISEQGEKAFRDIESAVIRELGKVSNAVIATGGGVVTRQENYAYLHQNGTIIWLRRNIEELACDDRPLSQLKGTKALYDERMPLYESFADIVIDISNDVSVTARLLIDAMEGNF